MAEEKPRFCAVVEFGSYVIKGCGETLQQAREDLIQKISQDPTLFEYEKVNLIRQIRMMEERGAV